jgi:hypothetical protein
MYKVFTSKSRTRRKEPEPGFGRPMIGALLRFPRENKR